MTAADLDLLTKFVESSPLIVLILLGFISLLMRWHHRMERRLELKDDQIVALQRETLQAMHDITAAVEKLTNALDRAR